MFQLLLRRDLREEGWVGTEETVFTIFKYHNSQGAGIILVASDLVSL